MSILQEGGFGAQVGDYVFVRRTDPESREHKYRIIEAKLMEFLIVPDGDPTSRPSRITRGPSILKPWIVEGTEERFEIRFAPSDETVISTIKSYVVFNEDYIMAIFLTLEDAVNSILSLLEEDVSLSRLYMEEYEDQFDTFEEFVEDTRNEAIMMRQLNMAGYNLAIREQDIQQPRQVVMIKSARKR